MSNIMITDEILLDMKAVKNDKLAVTQKQMQATEALMDKVQVFKTEKDEIGKKLAQLTKENDNLKLKFSQLLD